MKKILYIILFVLLVITFVILLCFTRDSKKIIDILDFVKTDIKVLYINDDINKKYPVELLKKYEIDYLEINSSSLSIFETKRIKEIINEKMINNSLVIFNNGKIVASLNDYKKTDDVDEYLQTNNVIPNKIVNNVEEIMNDAINLLDNSYTIVYMPYKELKQIESQEKILQHIANKYSLKYKKIDTYLLSDTQKEKINSLLGLSYVEDQIVLLIRDNKMIANIRGIHSKNTYVETLYDARFIDELEVKIINIKYKEFEEIIKSPEKNIIMIGDSLRDTKIVFELLNKMIYNYNIDVKYLDINESDELKNKIKLDLEEIGYSGSFSLPLVIISESNNILDYAIGNSKEEYFLDIFIETGVIKGDVIND